MELQLLAVIWAFVRFYFAYGLLFLAIYALWELWE